MRRLAITLLAAIFLGGMALALAGCGSESGTTAPTSDAGQAAQPAATPGIPAKAPTRPSVHLSLLTTNNCQRLYDIGKAFSAALTGDGGDDLNKTAALLTRFAAKTPSEIRPDFVVLAAAYGKISSALDGLPPSGSSGPTQDVVARLTKLSDQIDMAKVSAANTNVAIWASKNCRNYKIDAVQP